MRASLLLAALLLAGCLDAPAGEPGAGTDEPAAPEPLALRTLAQGSFSGIKEDTRQLVRSPSEWAALWERHRASEPRPEVDFPNETVVAVVIHGPTGCAAMHLGNVTYDPDEQVTEVVIVHERAPKEVQCFVAFEDVFHFAAIASRPGTARYHDVEGDPPQ